MQIIKTKGQKIGIVSDFRLKQFLMSHAGFIATYTQFKLEFRKVRIFVITKGTYRHMKNRIIGMAERYELGEVPIPEIISDQKREGL